MIASLDTVCNSFGESCWMGDVLDLEKNAGVAIDRDDFFHKVDKFTFHKWQIS